MKFRHVLSVVVASATLGAMTTASAKEMGGLNISGFVDVQTDWTRQSGHASSNGFRVYDGALYLSKDHSHGKVMVDLPFAWDNTAAAGSNGFKWAQDKAQAYGTYSLLDGMVDTQLGQFDSIYGFEAQDSADLAFTRAGILGGETGIPATHTGALVTMSPKVAAGNVTVQAVLANANGSGNKNGANFNYGGKIGFSNDMARAAAGILYFDAGAKNRQLYNIMVGATVGMFTADAEFDIIKDGRAVGSGGNGDQTGLGFLVHAVATPMEKVSLGARFEYAKKTLNNYGNTNLTFGPQFQVSDAVKVKADYTWNNVEATQGATKTSSHTIAGSAAYRF